MVSKLCAGISQWARRSADSGQTLLSAVGVQQLHQNTEMGLDSQAHLQQGTEYMSVQHCCLKRLVWTRVTWLLTAWPPGFLLLLQARLLDPACLAHQGAARGAEAGGILGHPGAADLPAFLQGVASHQPQP